MVLAVFVGIGFCVIGIFLFLIFAARFFRVMHLAHGVMSIAECYPACGLPPLLPLLSCSLLPC